MSFSINTNITSLQAQNYLRTSANFQAKTINEVTSGLRIVNSGDDAAGLAIANGLRSDQATLTQGIQNANNGLSTLQTIDGGINNISTLLDRANTLATQSASGTFSGDRNVLNKEFQSVVTEIDRQAQAIGLDTGGQFAKALSVFVGGGKANSGTTAISNGSISLDLSAATVDAKSLGLKGVQAVGVGTVDIGSGSAHTSVQAIVNDATNKGSEVVSGSTNFTFRGSGFGDANGVQVSVNLAGVTDTATLAAAINSGIQNAGNGSTQASTAFKNAGITASVVTDASGSHLAFSSSTAAFQVSAGDQTSNALLGNVTSGVNPTGKSLTNTVTGGAATAATTTTFGASGAGTVTFRIQGSSLAAPVDLQIAVGSAETIDTALSALSTAVASNAALKTAGITLSTATAGSALVFGDKSGQKVSVAASGDLNGLFGLGSFQSATGASGTFDYGTVTGNASGTFAASAETLELSVAGGAKVSLAVTPGAATIAGATTALNDAFASNSTLSKAGFVATNNGTQITITNNTSSNFQISSVGATNVFGFNNAGATGLAQTANTNSAQTTSNQFDTNGAYQTGTLTFTAPQLGTDKQTITLTADDTTGTQQSLAINLQNTGTTSNAQSVDQAIDSINNAIQQSNNATLQKVVAVKDQTGGGEGIKFVSTSAFQVSPGSTGSGAGIGSQGTLVAAALTGTGSTADISTEAGAASAVSALATAVSSLGVAQAVVGKGENNLNYAVALAQSQVTNEAAAESRIRDADLANEAANLSKAQILVQAGTAALAQANSAPQAILSLLKG